MALVPWNNTSYNTARADILARAGQGLGYDYDGYYGYQCLTKGHKVLMDDGSYKDISQLKQGDRLYGKIEVISNTVRITKVFTIVSSKGEITCSEDHLIMTSKGNFIEAKNIWPGKHRLRYFDGKRQGSAKVLYITGVTDSNIQEVYHLFLTGNSQYVANGFIHHNCWDLGANWYGIIGKAFQTKSSYTGAGGADSYVLTTWTYPPAFANNSTSPMTAITDLNQIKRGDMLIWGAGGAIAVSGHNAFADEDYNNGKDTIRALGQNQQNANFVSGHIPTLNDIPKRGLLGAFRYTLWEGGPGPEPPEPGPTPTPPLGIAKTSFPWVIYANKLRNHY